MTPLVSIGSDPLTSMILVDCVSTTLAPSTASFSTRTPSTTIHLDPIKQPSSIITGLACKGSSTPPMPTPPLKCTCLPICAQLPTVAQVSTMVPSSTYAPIFTYDGISTTFLATYAPYRATAWGTARTPSSLYPFFNNILS